MGSAVIFSGSNVKTLKSNIDINGQITILTGTVDPTSVATAANAGSEYHNTSTGIIYRKNDNGSSTNWSELLTAAVTSPDSSNELSNLSISATVASNALTVALKTKSGADPSGGSPVKIGFRNSTVTTGTYNQRSATAATSVVVSNGSTLGGASGVANYVYVYAIDNAGTVELAVGSIIVDDGSVLSTTAEGGAGAADSINIIYSTTARTSVPIRLIGRILITHTSGAWSASPTEVSIQPFKRLFPIAATATLNSGSVASNTLTVVNFANVTFDPANAISTGSGWAFSAPVAGYYRVDAKVVFDASGNWVAGDSCQLTIRVNTVDKIAGLKQWIETTTSTRDLGATAEGIVKLAANDFIDVRVRQISGGSRSFVPGNEDNHISINKIADF